jgi:ATP-binding protein involved in chromosome partitioning
MANLQICQGDVPYLEVPERTRRGVVPSRVHRPRAATLQNVGSATNFLASILVTTTDEIRAQLARVRYPGFARDIVALGLVRDVAVRDGQINVDLALPSDKPEVAATLRGEIMAAVDRLPGVTRVEIQFASETGVRGHSPRSSGDRTPLPGVERILAVASGKGGVGKSTVAVNLALALRARGLRVGLLDADIHGPSVPLMTGVSDVRPRMLEEKKIVPIERFGIALVSMGFFLDDRSPVIWRGPMVMSIVRQFLKDVVWGDLDILVVDLPPGTGDAQLTLLQEVPVAGGIIVTTPQDVALQDVKRGITMFETVQTPILGVIENMSEYVCPRCGTHEAIFGSDGGRREAQALNVQLLGTIPLVSDLRASMDRGTPLFIDQPEHLVSRSLADIADQVIATLDRRSRTVSTH